MGIEKVRDGIRCFRDRLRFNTQTDLANALKIEPQNVSKWEAGKSYPSYRVAAKLLEKGITVEELFGFEYNKRHNLTALDPPTQVSTGEMLLLNKLSDIEQKLANHDTELEEIKKARLVPRGPLVNAGSTG
jgi:transcriptional regulator with XRE-family HTH domain